MLYCPYVVFVLHVDMCACQYVRICRLTYINRKYHVLTVNQRITQEVHENLWLQCADRHKERERNTILQVVMHGYKHNTAYESNFREIIMQLDAVVDVDMNTNYDVNLDVNAWIDICTKQCIYI